MTERNICLCTVFIGKIIRESSFFHFYFLKIKVEGGKRSNGKRGAERRP